MGDLVALRESAHDCDNGWRSMQDFVPHRDKVRSIGGQRWLRSALRVVEKLLVAGLQIVNEDSRTVVY